MNLFYKGPLVTSDRYLGKIIEKDDKLLLEKRAEIIVTPKNDLGYLYKELLTGITIPSMDLIYLDVERTMGKIRKSVFPLNLKSFIVSGFCSRVSKFSTLDDNKDESKNLIDFSLVEDLDIIEKYCREHSNIREWYLYLKSILSLNNNNPLVKIANIEQEERLRSMDPYIKSLRKKD